MKPWMTYAIAIVVFSLGLVIGRKSAHTTSTLNPTEPWKGEHTSSRQTTRSDLGKRSKGSFKPLLDKRGFLALEDIPTPELRVIALYRALDDTTPENIGQMVEQFLAMPQGAHNRLVQLTGITNFSECLMQRYGKLVGGDALRLLNDQGLSNELSYGIRGFVGENPQAAMDYFAKNKSIFGYNAVSPFANELALAVMQKKISLAEWKSFMAQGIMTEHYDADHFTEFVDATSALVEGKPLNASLTESLDFESREYLMGLCPEYTALLDEMERAEYTIDSDTNTPQFGRLKPAERIAALHQILADSSIDKRQKTILLGQYLGPTDYDHIKRDFTPIWKTLDEEVRRTLSTTNLSDICNMDLDTQEMTELLQFEGGFDEKVGNFLQNQDETNKILDVAEFLEPMQRKHLIYAALTSNNLDDPHEIVSKWVDKADFLSDEEYQWMQNLIEQRENFAKLNASLQLIEKEFEEE